MVSHMISGRGDDDDDGKRLSRCVRGFSFRMQSFARNMMAKGAEAVDASVPGEYVKPFSPEQAKEIVMSLQHPAVFCNMASDWPALHWNVKYLANLLAGKRILFRMGVKDAGTAPLFETECSYVEATLEEFLAWSGRRPSHSSGPFSGYDLCKYWTYADYKYIAKVFEDKPEVFQDFFPHYLSCIQASKMYLYNEGSLRRKDIRWSDFGFSGRNGRESTLWIGTGEANTPCHLDSYGCNLVLQVQGRKRWHMYQPEDSSYLYPTRIPYEESSVFSKVNVINPNLKSYPQFKMAQAHVVTLEPGQVLFVPRHWWHYVESIDPITVSINSWIELDVDHEVRVEEAITRTLVCAIKSAENPGASDCWLNPTEVEVTSHKTNLQYLNGAVSAYLEHQKASTIECGDPGTTGSEWIHPDKCKRMKVEVNSELEGLRSVPHESHLKMIKMATLEKIPFGQSLLPVLPQSWETSATGRAGSNSRSVLNENEGHVRKLHSTRTTTVMDSDSETFADLKNPDCTASSPQTVISTNDLLDCVLDPQIIHLMARLLLERASV